MAIPAVSRRMRALGVDFGERRIGLAISDPRGSFALPWKVIARRDDRSAIDAIAALAAEEGIELLVVGSPRRPSDGAAGPAAARARRFGERLARRTGLPLEWVDEALTSREAAARLAEGGSRGGGRGARIDALAAQILLQDALDRRARASGPDRS
jgi:putative Holliday junction resolvase